LGLSYDPKGDVLDVALEGLDHLIRSPRDIYVEDGGIGLGSLGIVDAAGTGHVVKLRDPVALPARQVLQLARCPTGFGRILPLKEAGRRLHAADPRRPDSVSSG
jgi:hypothetical protein